MATHVLLDMPFLGLLLAAAAVDVRRRVVPNRLVAAGGAWAVGGALLLQPAAVPERIAFGGAALATLGALAFARPGAIGMGDAKLAGVMGLFLGPAVVPALATGFFAGAVAGAALVARRGLSARRAAIPFAPHLALGGVVGLVAGTELIDAYVAALA